MAHWTDGAELLLEARTCDLRSLAEIGGGDPKTFYCGANLRGADLSGQDLRGMEFRGADLTDIIIDEFTIFDESVKIDAAPPTWDIESTYVGGERVPVQVTRHWERSFCQLLHFDRKFSPRRPQPKILLVAPVLGCRSRAFCGTVESFLPNHDVYITNWTDGRMVPLSEGTFGLGNCIDYIISILHHLGGNTHVIGMSISSVPVLAAIAAMEAQNDPNVPHSMILMGGPVGTKSGLPKELSELQALITEVPEFYRGSKRKVISANSIAKNRKGMLVDSAKEGFQDLSDQFRTTSIDVAAELYVQLAEAVFKHTLAKGQMMHHGVAINPSRIRRVALMTIEGDKDNFTQRGQTEAAHHLCANIPRERKAHWLQPNVDHLGIFGGDRFRAEIAPRISDFVLTAQLSNRTRRPAQSVTGRKEATSSKEPKHEKADFSSS